MMTDVRGTTRRSRLPPDSGATHAARARGLGDHWHVPVFRKQDPKSSSVQHLSDTQSESALHVSPFGHFEQFDPPQSTSVSPLFFIPSVQLTHLPLWQTPL